jgi:hypothetical protein
MSHFPFIACLHFQKSGPLAFALMHSTECANTAKKEYIYAY